MNAMMMILVTLFTVTQADTAVPGTAVQALPQALASLTELASDEAALVDAMRKIDLTRVANGNSAIEQAEQLMQKGEKDVAQARIEEAKKEFQLVRTGWEFVLNKYPKNARVQTYYGELLYDRYGEPEAAVKAWVLATSLDPNLGLPLNDLGIHYCHVGQYEQGVECYDKALKLDSTNVDFMFNLAQCYLTNFPAVQRIRKWTKPRLYKEAMKLSSKAVKLNPADFELTHDYAMNLLMAENFELKINWSDAVTAWREVRKIARNDDERMNAWMYEGRAWLAKRKYSEAQGCFEEALKLRPTSENAQNLLEEAKNKMIKDKPGTAGKTDKSVESSGGKLNETK